jgi:hypothetical protein
MTMLETYWDLIKFSQNPQATTTSFKTWASRWVQYKGSQRLWSKKYGKYFAKSWVACWRTQIKSCVSRPWNINPKRKDLWYRGCLPCYIMCFSTIDVDTCCLQPLHFEQGQTMVVIPFWWASCCSQCHNLSFHV